MKMHRRNILPLLCAAILSFGAMSPMVVVPSEAAAQTIELNAKTNNIHAGMPFVLQVAVRDFDENPQPEIDEFTISDASGQKTAEIQFMGVSPQISSMTQIINGHITRKKDVTFIYSFRITPKEEGTYIIPEIHVYQGSKSATSQKQSFTARAISSTPDMRMELKMPDRQLWVGETFEATLSWYLRREVGEYSFDIPILTMPEQFEVEEPDQDIRGHNIVIATGSRQIAFPFTKDMATVGGLQYDRYQIPIRVTPLKSGTINLKAARVSAQLVSGMEQDSWGFFGQKRYEPFQSIDSPKTLTVVDLPQSNRPASYSNAMGTNYSIEIRADRTIVKAGDPIILTIDIRSSAPMGGLLLPNLTSAGLNEQLFGVSTETPVGENIDGGKGQYIRRFTVPVRIKSERVTEIPPIAFSYFNPKNGEYSTVRSQPIALSVTATTKISSADVINSQKPAGANGADNANPAATPQPATDSGLSNLLQLNLATTQESLSKSNFSAYGRYLRMGIYAFPFVLWGIFAVIRKKRKADEEISEQRTAAKALKEALDKSATVEAKEASASISAALNALLTSTETPRQAFNPVLEKMEIAAYDPRNDHLSPELTKEIRETVKTHINPKFLHLISSILSLLFVVGIFIHTEAAEAQTPNTPAATESAQIDDSTLLNQATTAYHSAMSNTARAERIAGFKRSYSMFNTLAERHPETAEFQIDAGNAALNAADFGHAVLSYKRALLIDPSLTQAQNNLLYIQNSQGDIHHDEGRVLSSVFFLNNIPASTRLFLAAILFALGILLIIPWSSKHKHLLRWLSVLPLAAWIWLLVGVYSHTNDAEAVVMHETWLKTADNAGASNVQKTALMPGYSVKVLKTSPDWAQVQTGAGVQGWIQETDIERVEK